MNLISAKLKYFSHYHQNFPCSSPLFSFVSTVFALFLYFWHNSPVLPLKNFSSPKVPGKIKHIVGKIRQKQMDLIGIKPYISGLCPIKMQAKYPKDFFNFAPDFLQRDLDPKFYPDTIFLVTPYVHSALGYMSPEEFEARYYEGRYREAA